MDRLADTSRNLCKPTCAPKGTSTRGCLDGEHRAFTFVTAICPSSIPVGEVCSSSVSTQGDTCAFVTCRSAMGINTRVAMLGSIEYRAKRVILAPAVDIVITVECVRCVVDCFD